LEIGFIFRTIRIYPSRDEVTGSIVFDRLLKFEPMGIKRPSVRFTGELPPRISPKLLLYFSYN